MNNITQGASALAVFSFDSHQVRTVTRDGEVWFVLNDVTEALEFSRGRNAARMLDDDEKGAHIVSVRSESGVEQDREVTIVNESGLYSLILKSRKPEAKRFKKWVTAEVLPTIRKTGSYHAAPASADFTELARAHAGRANYVMAFDNNGLMILRELPPDAFIASATNLAELIAQPGGPVRRGYLPDIIQAAAKRLK